MHAFVPVNTCMGVCDTHVFWSHDLTSVPPVLPQEPFDAAGSSSAVTPDTLKVSEARTAIYRISSPSNKVQLCKPQDGTCIARSVCKG